MALGNRMAERSSLVIKRAKECVYNGMDCSLEQGMALERGAFSLCFSTEDQREGMEAFLEKRKPVSKEDKPENRQKAAAERAATNGTFPVMSSSAP